MSTVTIRAYVENISTALLTYSEIRLYRDTTPTGAFSTLADTETLVAGQEEYTFSDTGATANSYWRVRLYNPTGPVQSDLSPLISPAGLTLLRLRVAAAREAGAGFDGTCSSAGTTTTLVDTALIDSGVDGHFLEGAWVYRPDAVEDGDRVRRVKNAGFDEDAGTLSFARAYTNVPASAEAYQAFMFFPPIDQPGVAFSWDRAVREGLQDAPYVDQLILGEGTATGQKDYSLAAHTAYLSERSIRRVLLRSTNDNSIITDRDASNGGGFWTIEQNGAGNLTLRLTPAPTSAETVVVEFNRTDAELFTDDDVTLVDERVAVAATVLAAYRHLNLTAQPGKYTGEYQGALRRFNAAYRDARPTNVVVIG